MKKGPSKKAYRDLWIGVLGDTHHPFVDRKALDFAIDTLHKDATHVVQIGDLYDAYGASRFPRSLDIMTPAQEIEEGRLSACEMWERVKDRCPYAQKVQLMGNHDERPFKRVVEKLPEVMTLVAPSFRALYEFEGVTTIHDPSADFETHGIVFTHGYLSRFGEHARRANMPVVRGHSHKGGVTWLREGLWELDVGFLGDPRAPVFGYAAWKRSYQMTRGKGVIDEYGPRFVEFKERKK